jgi:hypothetical protein
MLKSVQDIEAFMQNNLMIVAEMIKKLPNSPKDGLISSAVDAFLVFCKRQIQKGKNWVTDLELTDALKHYHHVQGKESQWSNFPKIKKQNGNSLKSSMIIEQRKTISGTLDKKII